MRGLVQGVFFRDSCRREARRRGVTGWVRNADDGSVEAVFEGEAAAVEALMKWARQGPGSARVDELIAFEEEPQGERGFRIV